MQLMVADFDQSSGIVKLAPLERRRHALISDASQDDEGDQSGH
jgi:hypothetical protein